MDRALWLLLRLRLRGHLRRWGRNLRTIKGALLALVTTLLLLPSALFSLFGPQVQLGVQAHLLRRHGALGLFGFCLLNLILASDERAVYFGPAEVDFLFPGPFRRRQLLAYRMAGACFSSCLTALLMTLVFGHHARGFLPAFMGLFLMIELVVLVTMAVGLSVSTLGAVAFNRRRRLVLAGLVAIVCVVLFPRGRQALTLDAWEILDRLERSSIMRVVVWPFQPPVMAFTAERLWPDLAVWSLAGLAILGALGLVILALDAEYYEATAAASARIYTRMQKARLMKPVSRPIRTGLEVPTLPWWGGAGPALWRQLTTAARHPGRFAHLTFLFLLPVLIVLVVQNNARGGMPQNLRLAAPGVITISFAAALMVGNDFRSDLDRMDTLKSLPIAPTPLVIAELAVPVLLLTLAQAVSVGFMAAWCRDATLLASLPFLPPYNAALVEISSIFFLWFPVRTAASATMDASNVGRQFLIFFAMMFWTTVAAGAAAIVGLLVYHFVVASWTASLAAAWLTMAGLVALLVPLVVLAFTQFDVARDNPP
jgi:hypothetical protein